MSVYHQSPANLFTSWDVEGTNIALFSNSSELRFSVIRGESEVQEGKIPLNLYGISYALNLVKLFHDAIEFNLHRDLTNHKIQPSSFLPVLCTDILTNNEQNAEALNYSVALFGRVGTAREKDKDSQWALYNPTENRVYVDLKDNSPKMTEKFLLNAPRFNQPHEDERRNYEMTAFARQFRVVYSTDDLASQHFVSLKYVSKLDRNQILTNWTRAVTLISRDNWSRHAEIVIEGIDEEELPFLKLLHFRGEESISGGEGLSKIKTAIYFAKTQKGRVHIHDRLGKYQGQTQTWNLPAKNVKSMLDLAEWQIMRQQAGKKNWAYFNPREANSGIIGTFNSIFHFLLPYDGPKSIPFEVKKFDTYRAFEEYKNKHPALKVAFTKIFNNRKVVSLFPPKFVYNCQFDPYHNWACTYELDSRLDVAPGSEWTLPENAINIEIGVYPDNCITFARRMLFLAGFELPRTNNHPLNFDRPKHYTLNSHDFVATPLEKFGQLSNLVTLELGNIVEASKSGGTPQDVFEHLVKLKNGLFEMENIVETLGSDETSPDVLELLVEWKDYIYKMKQFVTNLESRY